MVKEFIIKEISDTIDLKKDIEKKLSGKGNSSSDSENLKSLISEQDDKLYELRKIYDFIEKAEQYQNLEKFGKNYAVKDPTFFQKENLDVMESERQHLAINLHDSIYQVLLHIADKADGAVALIDSDPVKAKSEVKTIARYMRDFMSRMSKEVIEVQQQSAFFAHSNNLNVPGKKFNSNSVDSPNQDMIDSLTRRERDVLISIAKGMSNKEIGSSLKISERTVKNHVSNIFKKIDVMDRTQAALFAIRNNLVDIF